MQPSAQFAPDFAVQINGHDIPAAMRASIVAVRYEDGLRGADRVELDLANPNLRWLRGHIRGLGTRPPTGLQIGPVAGPQLGDTGWFDLDNSLTLQMGYAEGGLHPVFDGEITGVEADFPESGMPMLKVVAHNKLHRLAQGKYSRGFGPLADVMIAAILSAENLLLPAIDPVVMAESAAVMALNLIFEGTGTKQRGQSGLELLKEIAARYDAEFWVEGDNLYLSRLSSAYGIFRSSEPVANLAWGRSLLSFSPRVSTIGQVAGVGAKFTLGILPLAFIVTVAWDFDRERLSIMVLPGEAGTVAASAKTLTGPLLMLFQRSLGKPADITKSALLLTHKLRDSVNNRLTGSGAAVGDPRIRAGSMIGIEGLGQDFSDVYRVTASVHSIDAGGYRTQFKVRKEILP
jgi:uncharacterized protein